MTRSKPVHIFALLFQFGCRCIAWYSVRVHRIIALQNLSIVMLLSANTSASIRVHLKSRRADSRWNASKKTPTYREIRSECGCARWRRIWLSGVASKQRKKNCIIPFIDRILNEFKTPSILSECSSCDNLCLGRFWVFLHWICTANTLKNNIVRACVCVRRRQAESNDFIHSFHLVIEWQRTYRTKRWQIHKNVFVRERQPFLFLNMDLHLCFSFHFASHRR